MKDQSYTENFLEVSRIAGTWIYWPSIKRDLHVPVMMVAQYKLNVLLLQV